MQNIEFSNDDLVLLISGLHDRIDKLKNTDLGSLQNNRDYQGDNLLLTELNKLINIRASLLNALVSRCKASGLDL
jgi:hypothetical protein